MRSFGRGATALVCAAVIASTAGAVAANAGAVAANAGVDAVSAAVPESATGVTATLQGSQLLVSWTHSPRALLLQSIDVQEVSTGVSTGSPSVAPDATSAALDLGDSGLLGGYSYAISVVSTYADPSHGPTRARSVSAEVTVPEVASAAPAEGPTCSIDTRSRLLTIAVPATDSYDVFGSHTITDRTVSVLKNSRRWKTLTVPGSAAGDATVTVPYDPLLGALGTRYSASYTVVSAVGSSGSTGACRASLTTPTPSRFVVQSKLQGGAVSVTWAKAKSALSPVAGYTVSWQLDAKPVRTKSVTADAKRSFRLPVGSAKRVRVDVLAVNELGGSARQGVLWLKSGTGWARG